LASDIPYTSLPKALGEFVIADRNSIVISGTHGKTTTTSLMAVVSDACKKQAGFLVGGIPENFGRSFRVPEGNWFIIEGDEYDTAFFDKVPKFTHYRPRYVILTSIEFDHADIYKDLEHVKSAFKKLVELVPHDGVIVAASGDKNIDEVVKGAKAKVIRYGVESGDYQIVERQMLSGRNHFSIKHGGQKIADIALKAPGEYNAMNAAAVFALSHFLGWNQNDVLQGLADFKGVKRRQQVLSTKNGITLIEDFAHHPTAVQKTIAAIREQYLASNSGKLMALFEPRSATSRRRIFQKDYVNAFKEADMVFLSTPYDQSKIGEEDRFSSAELVSDLNKEGVSAQEFSDVDVMAQALVMSNGAFGGIYQKLK
jgi:UDP-N-acetylmuramate: L-alanyl-gamma-D-glutamyl-meso-diaminopimelate ligase